MGLFPEFSDFFIGYASYHWNPVNKFIHIICIPMILSSSLGLMNHLGIHIPNPFIDNPLFNLNPSFLLILCISLAYLSIDFATGFISTCFYFGHWLANNYLYQYSIQNNLTNMHFKVALGIHIVCWIAQFVGHGFFERRAPALLDNLLYTLVAPNFVIIEIFFDLGYKKDVYKKCKKQVLKNIEEFQNKRKSAAKKTS
ncbi:endoplasmic reticulum membrane protein (macronuclear) [Tetrahymena thermophila SB210]|uniref:Endoplasmic reticulum membrane protein n=1 Tax=Tetrahymena thermophila (strain SB210) TaxID=312017 RepID=I7MGZ3_TETTS|nr:endoplasmic reticulum membrane protein [Tetrahymena thermophila SB210]EAS02165.2 endoplasmic reticulum membrane protein [Tetrahymena thermophila SB210]|eukprot:XP_001022410.2 endoplasmic reticulum membrane protein [Tetrahymena thermophila SB210]